MRLFRLIALLGVMALWTGCGLPDSFYLVPPAVGNQASPLGTPYFSITGTDRGSDTGAIFQGYEIYYKFYGNTNDSTFISDSTSFTTGSTNIDLQQAGFHRLCLGPGIIPGIVADTSAGYASAPLINMTQIDPAHISQSYTVTIKFNDENPSPPVLAVTPPNGPPTSYFIYTPPGNPAPTEYAEVRRFVTLVPGPGCKTFQSNANNSYALSTNYDTVGWSDLDLSGTAGNAIWNQVIGPNIGNIYVMLYALSYGKSIADFTPIYSSPVLLGYVTALVNP